MKWQGLRVIGALVASLALVACQSLIPAPSPTSIPSVTPAGVAKPFIAVVPEQARNGDQLTVVGTDWQSGDNIALELRPAASTAGTPISLGVAAVDAQGHFKFVSIVPQAAPAGQWTLVAFGGSPVQTATVRFDVVTTGATLTPSGSESTAAATSGAPPATATVATATASANTPTPLPASPTPAPTIPNPTATQLPTAPPTPTSTPVPPAPVIITDWRGDYFNNRSLSGVPVVTRNDVNIDFDWGNGPPDSRINPASFSVRWTRVLYFDLATYHFTLRMDDGARIWVDGVLVQDAWTNGAARDVATDLTLAAGYHDVRIEYYQSGGMASMRFGIARLQVPTPSATASPSATPTATSLPSQAPPPTASPTRTPLPASATATATPSRTATATSTPTARPTPTRVPATANATPSRTATATASLTPRASATASATATATPSPTATSTATATASPTPRPSATATATASATATPRPSATATATASPTVEPGPSITATLHGLTLTVQGNHWQAREAVTVQISQTRGVTRLMTLGSPPVDLAGTFMFTYVFTTPLQIPRGSTLYAIVHSPKYSVMVPVNVIPTGTRRGADLTPFRQYVLNLQRRIRRRP